MDFNYSEEQQMLADSLRRLIETDYGFARRRTIMRAGASFDRGMWATLAEMGVLGLTIPAAFSGFEESAATQLVVQRELGRGIVLEPVIPCAVIAAAILTRYGSDAHKAHWLPAIATGQRVLTAAWLEPASRYRVDAAQCTATRAGAGWELSGVKCLVWHGHSADAWIVSARLDGKLALFLVPRDAAGVTIAQYPAIDGQHGADLRFDCVRLDADALLGGQDQGLEALEHGLDHGIAAQCAAAAGAMERLIDLTRDYLLTRRQFGQPLAAFQALQHRLADMLVQKECALSMAYVAAKALDEPDLSARRRMVSGAKVIVARAARFVGQQAVQLHGGMGVTDELEVSDYFRYLTMTDVLLGDTDAHMERYCAAMAA
ncbi:MULTISPECIES: acyl-CoA dehydrogenase family protein [unclassified Paraburkholderia]|uniref:acyl-CoA dehydrogenase family protein n=1 Tax=unclassified Paraburkholderia TaxID=2615204 RepID=UPI002AB1F932|nr:MULTISPECIES: acyl-CoA dehydrogenase family protein [unclassified Paraburkholderia]